MSNTITTTNPIADAHATLIERLQKLHIPRIPVAPWAVDFYNLAEMVREASNLFDEYLYAIGSEVADNSTLPVDMRLFSGAYLGAVDGDAIFQIEECAEAVAEAARAGRRAA